MPIFTLDRIVSEPFGLRRSKAPSRRLGIEWSLRDAAKAPPLAERIEIKDEELSGQAGI
ncbi:hypothetical protein Lbir_1201 [Legionella birminghamensis]|uniref:Uncharacterized protein n=1 Tax=Legionella birminghamensis TaxID=28083 RepID=A0A378I5S1_9GAMM|nr:hypothetical protein Lbir_1201 [Legionella birminghamensis]STX30558.1 Uncharacterised protein [Legionella birminghamensis]